MRSLKEALRDNQQRFRKMPKGPVGSYIRLKDYKWSTAVEQVLKGVLFCFVVDNPYDDAEFKRLANGVFRRGSHSGNTPRIDTIISSFQVGCPGVMSCDLSMWCHVTVELISLPFQDRVYDVSRNVSLSPAYIVTLYNVHGTVKSVHIITSCTGIAGLLHRTKLK